MSIHIIAFIYVSTYSSVTPTTGQRTACGFACGLGLLCAARLAEVASETQEERFLTVKKQRDILQGRQRQGRLIFVVCGSGILLAALLVAGFAYAAALRQNHTLVNEDALNKIASAPQTTTHTPVVHTAITPTAAIPTVIAQATVVPTPVVQAPVTPTQAPVAPTPVPQAPVTNSPPQQVSGSYTDMIYQVFGSAYGAGAVNVAMCESSMNPNAYNSVLGAAGLFQIIPSTFASTSYAGQSVYNPLVNIEAAHEIFVRDGDSWSEWQCQP